VLKAKCCFHLFLQTNIFPETIPQSPEIPQIVNIWLKFQYTGEQPVE